MNERYFKDPVVEEKYVAESDLQLLLDSLIRLGYKKVEVPLIYGEVRPLDFSSFNSRDNIYTRYSKRLLEESSKLYARVGIVSFLGKDQ